MHLNHISRTILNLKGVFPLFYVAPVMVTSFSPLLPCQVTAVKLTFVCLLYVISFLCVSESTGEHTLEKFYSAGLCVLLWFVFLDLAFLAHVCLGSLVSLPCCHLLGWLCARFQGVMPISAGLRCQWNRDLATGSAESLPGGQTASNYAHVLHYME